jgi:uncharacterized protein YcbX
MHISEINVYPVKSMRGTSLKEAMICGYGLEHDRQWMLVDDNARMITQRECPKLALLVPSIEDGHLRVAIPGAAEILVPSVGESCTDENVIVELWGQQYVGVAAVDSTNAALSKAIGRSCRLLSIRSDVFRTNTVVAFHDDAPILIISQASLEELNRRMPSPLPMNRFRPTFVVACCDAFAEDTWQRIAIAGVAFRAVKQCVRCAITTVDQAEGAFRGPEPLKTLATFRRKKENVAFGAYFRPDSSGAKLKLGDELRVLEEHAYATME